MSAPQPQGRPHRSPHPLAPWFDYVPPGLAGMIRQLLQDLNTQAADMVASDNEQVREQGRELARRVLSEPYLAASVEPQQSQKPGF